MTRALTIIVLVASSVLAPQQQGRDAAKPITVGTAQVAGKVVIAGETPMPLRRATVTLAGEQSALKLVATTDDDGAFAFRSLPADRYTLAASKAAYLPATYGSKRPGGSGTPILVSDGQRVTAVIPLLRGSVIGGTVRDEQGRALPEVTVTARRYAVSYETGERTLQSVTIGSAGSMVNGYAPDAFPGTAVTDDRGMYRIYGLPPGEYLVSAAVRPRGGSPLASTDVYQISDADIQRAQQLLRGTGAGAAGVSTTGVARSGSGSRVDWVPAFHPAAVSRDLASTIVLGAAEEKSGIDVQVRLVPTAKVSGVVTAIDGTPQSGAQVSVMDPEPGASGVQKTARSNFDGEYVIEGVPPGRYEIQASAYPAGLFGTAAVTIEGRDIEASFVLLPGVTLSGRVVFDGTSPPPSFTPSQLILRREPWTIGGGGLEQTPDGKFKFLRVVPGRYRLGINGRAPTGWILRSVTVNGVETSDVLFDIKRGENIEDVVVTLTDRPAEISGTLQAANGDAAPEYTLVVFPADSKYWLPRSRRTQSVRPDPTGKFIARNLPAGNYLISAVTDLEDGQWNDSAFLAALAAAGPVRVSVAEGEKKVQNIRVGR